MEDKEFLQWIHDRLIDVHGENPNFDYMHRLRTIISPVKKEGKVYYNLVDAPPGLYKIYWVGENGSSLASIGISRDGEQWFAPTNWVSPYDPDISSHFDPNKEIDRLERVDMFL
jgi:hypothetical protein